MKLLVFVLILALFILSSSILTQTLCFPDADNQMINCTPILLAPVADVCDRSHEINQDDVKSNLSLKLCLINQNSSSRQLKMTIKNKKTLDIFTLLVDQAYFKINTIASTIYQANPSYLFDEIYEDFSNFQINENGQLLNYVQINRKSRTVYFIFQKQLDQQIYLVITQVTRQNDRLNQIQKLLKSLNLPSPSNCTSNCIDEIKKIQTKYTDLQLKYNITTNTLNQLTSRITSLQSNSSNNNSSNQNTQIINAKIDSLNKSIDNLKNQTQKQILSINSSVNTINTQMGVIKSNFEALKTAIEMSNSSAIDLSKIIADITDQQKELVKLKQDTIKNFTEVINLQDSRYAEIKNNITILNNKSIIMEGNITSIRNENIQLKTRTTNLQSNLAKVEVNITSLKNNIQTISIKINSTEQNVNKLTQDHQTISTKIENIQSKLDTHITTINTEIASIKQTIANLNNSGGGNNVDLTQLKNQVTTLENRVNKLQVNVTTLNNTIQTVRTTADNANIDIDNLQTKVNQNIAAINTQITSIKQTIANLNSTGGSGGNSGDLTQLKKKDAQLQKGLIQTKASLQIFRSNYSQLYAFNNYFNETIRSQNLNNYIIQQNGLNFAITYTRDKVYFGYIYPIYLEQGKTNRLRIFQRKTKGRNVMYGICTQRAFKMENPQLQNDTRMYSAINGGTWQRGGSAVSLRGTITNDGTYLNLVADINALRFTIEHEISGRNNTVIQTMVIAENIKKSKYYFIINMLDKDDVVDIIPYE